VTDRELLEAAAKAAGVPLRVVGANPGLYALYPETDGVDRMRCMQQWNPLTDDGDALRLAVALWIDVLHFGGATIQARAGEGPIATEYVNIGAAPYAATRRAIVRAAAMLAQSPAAAQSAP
jgi:hypothetical protein